jgi:hypothetical protein
MWGMLQLAQPGDSRAKPAAHRAEDPARTGATLICTFHLALASASVLFCSLYSRKSLKSRTGSAKFARSPKKPGIGATEYSCLLQRAG